MHRRRWLARPRRRGTEPAVHRCLASLAAAGNVTTYPAIYLWNQNILVDATGTAIIQQTSNLTPAWDDFSIPEVPPVSEVPR